ncbi:NAD-dependent epimerase/dehydratase family protein [Phyllobacterium sp. YR531]|uniref:NAD-dependent epimerase/dehydratase family protein n=1 Tax=Phyllobacterium sp. YR531 TaxID=1144343 RepID=UPI00026F49A8|nr:NAD-dependent epimerase/dehydratase family protein [Phyllobacterium sp. YR531]EJN03104.1 nucleoside-diphosphate-sugar epimerase [Phyllobacterium sp. YR531]
MASETVLITGATGFVGVELTSKLKSVGYDVITAARDDSNAGHGPEIARLPSPDEPDAAFEAILAGVDHVVHLAAIAHANLENATEVYNSVNFVLPVKLARAADKTIRGKFVFMSSIRAQCASIHQGVALETDEPKPTDDYGRAKLKAEIGIAEVMPRRNYTILRPVLVYGAGVKGNMAALMKLAALPIPLPFRSLVGKRSLVDRSSLCNAVIHCLNQPKTNGGTFIVADTSPVTVPQIVGAMRRAKKRRSLLFACPVWVMDALASITGQRGRWDTLSGNLVASSKLLQSTGWQAVENTPAEIEKLVG